jgi:hypothetical protein
MSIPEPLDLEPIRKRSERYMSTWANSLTTVGIDRRDLLHEVERLRNTEAWDEVERLRGQVERLQVEKHDLVERLLQIGSDLP